MYADVRRPRVVAFCTLVTGLAKSSYRTGAANWRPAEPLAFLIQAMNLLQRYCHRDEPD
jgi:hypothetical protein